MSGRRRRRLDGLIRRARQALYRRWRRRHRTPPVEPRPMTAVEAAGYGGHDAPTAWRKGISR